MEPPHIPNLAAQGRLCYLCYPGAGDPGVMCEGCLRTELAAHTNQITDSSHTAVIATMTEMVIPMRYQSAKREHELDELRRIDPLRRGALLFGPAGRGKTYQASILMRRAIEYAAQRGMVLRADFQWHSAPGLIERLKQDMKKRDAVRSLLEQLTDARVLVIDDLGAEIPTAWVRERLLQVLTARYDAMRPVIVTTNLNPEQLEKQLGARITGRLMEDCFVLPVTGANRRDPRQQSLTPGDTAA